MLSDVIKNLSLLPTGGREIYMQVLPYNFHYRAF